MVKLEQSYLLGGVVGLYIVAALYAFLAILLGVRLYHKIKSHRLRCLEAETNGETPVPCHRNFSIWVLSGFVVEAFMRSFSLFWMASHAIGVDNVVMAPAILYFALMCLLTTMWHRWISRRQGYQSRPRLILLCWLAIETFVLLALLIWRTADRDSMFKYQESIIFYSDSHLSLLAGVLLVLISRQLFKEKSRMELETEKAAASKLFRSCLVLAVFCMVRGVWILTVGLYHPLQSRFAQSIIVPLFYGLQWLALLGSLGILVGPQRESDSERQTIVSTKYRNAADVAYITSQRIGRPVSTNTNGSPRYGHYETIN